MSPQKDFSEPSPPLSAAPLSNLVYHSSEQLTDPVWDSSESLKPAGLLSRNLCQTTWRDSFE